MPDENQYEVFLVALPTRAALRTAIDSTPSPDRELVFVRVTSPDGLHGWGECSALNKAGYTAEWARGAFGMLTSGVGIDRVLHPMASTALELADLDLELRNSGTSLAAHLGATTNSVPAGAVVGLGSMSQTIEAVDDLVSDGFRRVKLKVAPGAVLKQVKKIRQRFPNLELQVDANGSLAAEDFDDLVKLDELEVSVIEQPFRSDESELTTRLARTVGSLVVADEAIRTLAEAQTRRFYDGMVIKPGPVGGIGATLELVAFAAEANWQLSAGGMLESGLGRSVLAAVAAIKQFGITGDLSPAGRWLANDPWPDLSMVDGRIEVPSQPGLGAEPDMEMLLNFTLARGRVLRR